MIAHLEQENESSTTSDGVAVRTFILKIASRCNLNCTYCYVYNKGDTSYLRQPQRMSTEVAVATLGRIRQHCIRHSLQQVELIFHGGEPLLAGKDFFRQFTADAARMLLPDVTPTFNMQTNGTLLDEDWLNLLIDLKIGFGISLDGPKEINDRNRVDHRGAGSYDTVRKAVDLVLAEPRAAPLFGGLLTVISLDADPGDLYRLYRRIGVSMVDFLLPDGHYGNLPPRLSLDGTATPYADWLIKIFDEWFDEGDPSFHIRIFENILDLIFGTAETTDYIGGGQNRILVVETDGGIEPLDVLKICGNNFTKLGYNVLANSIDDVGMSPLIRKYQLGGLDDLCDTCRTCRIHDVCGGGYLPHRYSPDTGLNNPSVYCQDLKRLITHIQAKMLATLSPQVRDKLGLMPIAFDDLIARQAT